MTIRDAHFPHFVRHHQMVSSSYFSRRDTMVCQFAVISSSDKREGRFRVPLPRYTRQDGS